MRRKRKGDCEKEEEDWEVRRNRKGECEKEEEDWEVIRKRKGKGRLGVELRKKERGGRFVERDCMVKGRHRMKVSMNRKIRQCE